jgi:5'-deoxynucleotidase YfbR-like HD superfamily hydrolase
MRCGTPVDLEAIDLTEADLDSMFRQLAQLNRHTGATVEPVSVLQHSLWVSESLSFDSMIALYGLIHDLHEAIVGDMATPIKVFLRQHGNDAYDRLEAAAERAVLKRFGLPEPTIEQAAMVKQADLAVLMAERADFRTNSKRDWLIHVSPALISEPIRPHFPLVKAYKQRLKALLERTGYYHERNKA